MIKNQRSAFDLIESMTIINSRNGDFILLGGELKA